MHPFNELMVVNAPPALESLLEAYRDSWDSRTENTIRYRRDEDRAHHTGVALRMLRALQKSTFLQPEGTILGVEEELRGPAISGCPNLLARIDLLVETDDAVIITDLKTARSR